MAKEIEVKVPDIGSATQVDVIEILVQVGDTVALETPLITLETDKATMEIPSPQAGIVKKIQIKLGDKVSQGHPILTLEVVSQEAATNQVVEEKVEELIPESQPKAESKTEAESKPEESKPSATTGEFLLVSAGPAVRRMAREFGVDLSLVQGSARKERITKEDLQHYVKKQLQEKQTAGGQSLHGHPVIDFSKFGEIESKPLSKIKKMTGINLHRSWISIPHVTQFDEADITELESFRKSQEKSAKESGYKLTLLAFVCKVVSKALKVYPQFNASLDSTGSQLIYKKYCNLGIAVETVNGLVVPVIKNVDSLGLAQIAQEMARLSSKARDKGLMPDDMSGGCFTISSLGGLGGTAFTPIVNSPEVAILGLSRATLKPVYNNGLWEPKLFLPLSLSYDHRVIDGAEAARFTRFVCDGLKDIRTILL